jgi:DNA primase
MKEPKIDEALERKVRAMKLLRSPHFFDLFLKDVSKAGLVGEQKNVLAIFRLGLSRLFARPLNLFVKGPSSTGKNFLVKTVLRFFPANCVIEMTSGTGASWSYQNRNLVHKVVYVQEQNTAAGDIHPARLLISENELIRMVTVRSGKKFRVTKKVTKGPAAFISTTTKDKLAVDDETRHFSIWTDNSPEQTRRILLAEANTGKGISDDELAVWHEVQRLLAERGKLPIEVGSWVEVLANQISPENERVRRYFPAFLQACQTVCLARSFQFDEDELEKRGVLKVRFTDYAIASLILDTALNQSLSYSDDEDRQLQEAMDRIWKRTKRNGVEASELARELRISEGKAYSRLREAAASGAIRRVNEPAKGNKKLYLPTAPAQMLPEPAAVFTALSHGPSAVRFIHPVSGEAVEYRKRRTE